MTIAGNILITGGAGTLGRAIVRTAREQGWPAQFTILSRGELLQSQMRKLFPECRYVLGDVRDYERLAAAVAGHDVVIHAAAMKRIPECEANPTECLATNVHGSVNVVRACIAAGVDRCVGVSTDKACRASTIYGASKLAMEAVFRAAGSNETRFTLVRYGNVVASRGSVVPLWREQAHQGRPLTITDRRMTRFFMAESDAVDLIDRALRAAPGTITIPKMGALALLDLAGLIAPGAPVQEIGLRSDEKLHEDLVNEDEAVTETSTHYVVSPLGTRGTRYTSDNARRLAPDEFLAMLEEAEQHEYA